MIRKISFISVALIFLMSLIPTSAFSDDNSSNFNDGFDGSLASGWEWIRPDPANWSLTESPGHLRITTQRGELWGGSWHRPLGNNLKNLLVRDAPDGDFEIETMVNFIPTFFHHQAAIVVYQDDDNYIRLSREYSSQRCSFTRETGATQDIFIRQTIRPIMEYTTTYLKIKKTGNVYTGYYSADGISWTQVEGTELETNNPNVNSFAADLDPDKLKVGLYACSGLYEAGGSHGQKDADFDYFAVNSSQMSRKHSGEAPGCGGAHQLAINNAIDKGMEYLRGQQQNDGSWICSRAGSARVGGTALAVLAFLSQDVPESDPVVSTGIDFILSKVQDDGSIYTDNRHTAYETSCALMALGKTENTKYEQTINNARQWLIDAQNDEPEYQTSNNKYGAWGYGPPRTGSADLSNTQYALIALAATPGGIPTGTAHKLMTFLGNMQHSNGGFAYSPGRSPWASMTAAGIWCLYLTGVGKNDARV